MVVRKRALLMTIPHNIKKCFTTERGRPFTQKKVPGQVLTPVMDRTLQPPSSSHQSTPIFRTIRPRFKPNSNPCCGYSCCRRIIHKNCQQCYKCSSSSKYQLRGAWNELFASSGWSTLLFLFCKNTNCTKFQDWLITNSLVFFPFSSDFSKTVLEHKCFGCVLLPILVRDTKLCN